MRIGVLALQGAFAEHAAMLKTQGVQTVLVRLPEHLDGLAGLILPGGESTSMRLLTREYGLVDALGAFARTRPVWGVCAGLILLAQQVDGEEPVLGPMKMTVVRNAYGRQQNSFVAGLGLDCVTGGMFPGVFIRAPKIKDTGPGVEVLARHEGAPVALRQGHLLATTFHPELTGDARMHRYFLDFCM